MAEVVLTKEQAQRFVALAELAMDGENWFADWMEENLLYERGRTAEHVIRAVVAALDQTASAGALKVGDLVEWAGAEWIIVVVKEFADIYSERSGATYRVPTSDLKRVEEVSNG